MARRCWKGRGWAPFLLLLMMVLLMLMVGRTAVVEAVEEATAEEGDVDTVVEGEEGDAGVTGVPEVTVDTLDGEEDVLQQQGFFSVLLSAWEYFSSMRAVPAREEERDEEEVLAEFDASKKNKKKKKKGGAVVGGPAPLMYLRVGEIGEQEATLHWHLPPGRVLNMTVGWGELGAKSAARAVQELQRAGGKASVPSSPKSGQSAVVAASQADNRGFVAHKLTGLKPFTVYLVKVYSSSPEGTSPPKAVVFRTPGLQDGVQEPAVTNEKELQEALANPHRARQKQEQEKARAAKKQEKKQKKKTVAATAAAKKKAPQQKASPLAAAPKQQQQQHQVLLPKAGEPQVLRPPPKQVLLVQLEEEEEDAL